MKYHATATGSYYYCSDVVKIAASTTGTREGGEGALASCMAVVGEPYTCQIFNVGFFNECASGSCTVVLVSLLDNGTNGISSRKFLEGECLIEE